MISNLSCIKGCEILLGRPKPGIITFKSFYFVEIMRAE